jgi:uncharacterized membrane protein HdeD (DUF308 family)/acetyl esterase/lipase
MRALSGRTPAWLSVAMGVATIAVGLSLTFKPFSSLGTLILLAAASLIIAGAGELISGRPPTNLWLSRSLGLFLIATGVAVLILPDVTIGLLATVVGVGLVIGGLARVFAGVRGPDDRFVLIISGLALVVLGGIALSWPDLTVLGVALLVGPAAVILGIGQIIRGLSKDEAEAGPARGRPSRLRRYSRPVIAVASLVLVLGFAGISYLLHRATPTMTAFYRTPANLPAKPGQLLRHEDVRFQGMPAGTNAQRVLYTTTKVDGSIAVASAVVAWPKQASDAPRPVLAWTHGTTGVAQQCAPSLLTNSFDYSMPPAVEAIMKRGWVIVATDYIGLGTQGPHPYLIGVPEGRSELDAVRAARQLEGVDAGDKTVVWGHSQGGHAALWVGIEAARHAPDVPLSGVAALAPASDLAGMATRLGDDPLGAIFKSFIITAYSRIYPDVSFDDYVRAGARLIVRETAQRCIVSPEIFAVIGLKLSKEPVFARNFGSGPLAARLKENIPDQRTGVPTFIGQGLTDVSVIPELQRAFAERLCTAGQIIDYRGYAGRDHMGVIAADSPVIPDVLKWTEARFARKLPGDTCSFAER